MKRIVTYIFISCIMLGSISCAPEDTRSDSEKYPNIPSYVFEFFEATIFQNKDNKIEYVSDAREHRKGKFRYQFSVDFEGTFKPDLVGYLEFVNNNYQMPATNAVKTNFLQSDSADILYYGLSELSKDELRSAYLKFQSFMGNNFLSQSEFEQTDFSNSCFITRTNENGKRKVFAAILYDAKDEHNYQYKERVVSCYIGAQFVQMGI